MMRIHNKLGLRHAARLRSIKIKQLSIAGVPRLSRGRRVNKSYYRVAIVVSLLNRSGISSIDRKADLRESALSPACKSPSRATFRFPSRRMVDDIHGRLSASVIYAKVK